MTKCAWVDLHLKNPVLVTGPGGGDPNSEITLPYIPGSVLRGMFVAHYPGTKDVQNGEFRRLFFDGGVRYLNGYLYQGGKRSLPTPASWHMIKDSDLGNDLVNVHDLAHNHSGDTTSTDNRPLKSLGGSFYTDGDSLFPKDPAQHVAIHIARSDRQRPTAGGSTVFRYDSLAPGQTFRAALLTDEDDAIAALQAMIPDGTELSIGRSHRAGYGLVRITWPDVMDEWHEYTPQDNPVDDVLVVTLLSDCLVRHPKTGAYVDNLEPILNETALSAFVQTQVVGGFNRKWNLPLPQATAIRAGSVFVYHNSPELFERLHTLQESGLGERTVEGFGRIALNWHTDTKFELSKREFAPEDDLKEPPTELTGSAEAMAKTMVGRLTEIKLENALREHLDDFKITCQPSNNQLARLRIVVKKDLREATQARIQGNPQPKMASLRDYLRPNKLRKPARDQLRRAVIKNESLLQWLSALADNPQVVWKRLDIQQTYSTIKIGSITQESSEADAVYYSARLVDAICRQAMREVSND